MAVISIGVIEYLLSQGVREKEIEIEREREVRMK